ncbi:MAG: hypothetical protein E7K72_25495 [Roseomonas mucosa]|nr:hypothetical protein [Roseomonas mucosa]
MSAPARVFRAEPVPALLDVGSLAPERCDHCLDAFYKALRSDPPAGDRSIWRPVENPFLTQHVEQVTARLQGILLRLQEAISAILLGEPLTELAKADTPWLRWSEVDFEAAKNRLEAIPPSSYSLDDWMLLVDWLIQRFLPDDVIRTEAEFLAVRATILGQMQAALVRPPPADEMASFLPLIPTSFRKIPPKALTPTETAILRISIERAATNISGVTASARAGMKRIIMEHVQAQVLGQSEGTAAQLKTRLFDNFAQLNRDFRRIAVTEAGEIVNQGVVAAQQPGTKLRRMEAYQGACDFCRSPALPWLLGSRDRPGQAIGPVQRFPHPPRREA